MRFQDTFVASRRLFLLRLLVESGGSANGSILWRAATSAGFAQTGRADLATDLDHLAASGCTRDEWLGELRVVTLTDRGEDAAYGRITVDGVEHSRWSR